jgi:hypothetical protein
MSYSIRELSYKDRLQDPIKFTTEFKNALHGYTAAYYGHPTSYQKHLTDVQIMFKTLKNTSRKRYFLNLEEIILNFQKFDYSDSDNMLTIQDRIGNDAFWKIYLDFINRITCEKIDEIILDDTFNFIGGVPSSGDMLLLQCMQKQLARFAPNVTITFIKDLLQNKPPRRPLLWTGGQYSFDYFIKSLPGLCKHKYNDALHYYFLFPTGAAKVRTGGGFESTHKDKPYKESIDAIIQDINKLYKYNKFNKNRDWMPSKYGI